MNIGRTVNPFFTAVFVAVLSAFMSAAALAQSLPVVRDAEIEALLKDYARPIFKVAGLNQKGIEIILINNNSFNAFVDGRRIFVNTGAVATAASPNEIIGVIAHESGHIAGGHQHRLREQIARTKALAVVGTLVGLGAAAGGSIGGIDGAAKGGTGLAAAAPSVAMRALLSYKRGEEITADQAAIKYLNATGQSAKGMLDTFKRFTQDRVLAGVNVNPYELSHPLPVERIALLEELARKSPHYGKKDSPSLQLRHDMARGKIAAYSGGVPQVARLFRNDPSNPGARYGKAIAAYLRGNVSGALKDIDGLLSQQPKNPYLHEMKGEILMKARQPKKAAASFAKAVKLDPTRSGVIRGQLGFAYLSTGDPSLTSKAIKELKASLSVDPYNFSAYIYLARAYAQSGDVANAELTQAEGNFIAGNIDEAKRFAIRAQMKLPRSTPAWQRADDIIKYKKPKS